jgi:hypothetical protein
MGPVDSFQKGGVGLGEFPPALSAYPEKATTLLSRQPLLQFGVLADQPSMLFEHFE